MIDEHPLVDERWLDQTAELNAAGGPTMAKFALGVFLRSAPRRLAELQEPGVDRARKAHAWKGTVSMCGLARLAAHLSCIEDTPEDDALIEALDAVVSQTIAAANAYVARPATDR
ncbi:MAG: hypothetical protein KDI56_01595 [Xanthomonadales bacterium]|nr:hypothetical protein [Xanthomonadales bacterium]MCB1636833.1 hypothetical protein [Xanthomonadales bacterium]